MTLSRSRLALVGGLTLLAGLLIFFPARIAYQWFAPAQLKLAGIQGSVWSGRASETSVGGVYLRDLSWRVQPLRLFTGELAYSIQGSPPSGFIEGDVAVGVTGGLTASDIKGAIPLQSLRDAFGNAGLAGSLSLQIAELQAEGDVPTSATGSFEIANLINPFWYRYSLGGYRAEIVTEASGIVVSLADTDGVVAIDGRLQLFPDGRFEFVGLLAAKTDTPPNIRQAVEYLPLADDGVRHIYQFEGEI